MRRKTRHSRDLEREDLDQDAHVELEDDREDVAEEADNDAEETANETKDTVDEAEDDLEQLGDDDADVLEEVRDDIGGRAVADVEDAAEGGEDELGEVLVFVNRSIARGSMRRTLRRSATILPTELTSVTSPRTAETSRPVRALTSVRRSPRMSLTSPSSSETACSVALAGWR